MSPEEVAWVAGLLEGEGCFFITWSQTRVGEYPRMQLRCCMTDEDIVRKLYSMVGGKVSGPIQKKKVSADGQLPKLQWLWVMGRRNGAEDLMKRIRPYMGTRRGAKIDEILAAGKAYPGYTNSRSSDEEKYPNRHQMGEKK